MYRYEYETAWNRTYTGNGFYGGNIRGIQIKIRYYEHILGS